MSRLAIPRGRLAEVLAVAPRETYRFFRSGVVRGSVAETEVLWVLNLKRRNGMPELRGLDELPQMLTAEQAAEACGISVRRIYAACGRGLPHWRFSARIMRTSAEALRAWAGR